MGTQPESKTHRALVEYLKANKLGQVDSREWKADWRERWVVFADLIAFAGRAMRSNDVVLNNILRFDRASSVTKAAFPSVRVFRFSDSTFGVSDTFHEALAFAIGLQHTCLAMNAEFLDRSKKQLFIHMVVPRVTIAKGQVLMLPPGSSPSLRFHAIDPGSVIAGEGVVKAYGLERQSAGSLISIARQDSVELTKLTLRGGNVSAQASVDRWIKRLHAKPQPKFGCLFARKEVLDFPWLLMRPFQTTPEQLWCATKPESNETIRRFFDIWKLSELEYYSPQASVEPLEAAKHRTAAIRHGIHCTQMRLGQVSPHFYSIDQAREMLSLEA